MEEVLFCCEPVDNKDDCINEYEPPKIVFVPLKIEERLMKCPGIRSDCMGQPGFFDT